MSITLKLKLKSFVQFCLLRTTPRIVCSIVNLSLCFGELTLFQWLDVDVSTTAWVLSIWKCGILSAHF